MDPAKVGVSGLSYGGCLTGFLIGHSKYCHLWAAANARNAILDFSYMSYTSDVPDWVHAAALNKPMSHIVTGEEAKTLHERSPIGLVNNVRTPLLIQVGELDKRCPPHQSYKYMHALKERGIECKLQKYPGENHILEAKFETVADVAINMALWFDKYLL